MRVDVLEGGTEAGIEVAVPPPDGTPIEPECTTPPAMDACVASYEVSCNYYVDARVLGIGAECLPYCKLTFCDALYELACMFMPQSGGTTIRCYSMKDVNTSGGRRPEGLRIAPVHDDVPGWLAHSAALEAASVPAFRRMARELAGFGAPRQLVRAARRAVREEINHARTMRSLARERGAAPATISIGAFAPRSLEEFAVENAREGCTFEAFAALVARHQARAAPTRALRHVFSRIARDEFRHAALALATHEWVMSQLDAAARTRVETARDAAFEELASSPSPAIPALGLPSPNGLRGIVNALRTWTS